MLKNILYCSLLMMLAFPVISSAEEKSNEGVAVELNASIYPEAGWMKGGWGKVVLRLENTGSDKARIKNVKFSWMDKDGSAFSEWSKNINKDLKSGAKSKEQLTTWFNPSALENGPEAGAHLKLFVVCEIDGSEQLLPAEITIPEAVLPEALKTITGENISLSLMESRFGLVDNMDEILASMDQMYAAMEDLTGRKPFGGKVIDFKECPRHMAWAYAGNPTVLNTAYVADSLKTYSKGEISFGWVHEMGHDFDNGIGKWYIAGSQWAEWQANFKLSYAWEMKALNNSEFKVRLWQPGKSRSTLPMVTGRQFTDAYFIPFGIDYLADPERSWKTLMSDEIHSFHTLLARQYGWELYKNWYRSYQKLVAMGLKPPRKNEEKITLECAILSAISGDDLSATFKKWRLPVTDDGLAAVREKYPVAEVAATLNGDISGRWIDPLPKL